MMIDPLPSTELISAGSQWADFQIGP